MAAIRSSDADASEGPCVTLGCLFLRSLQSDSVRAIDLKRDDGRRIKMTSAEPHVGASIGDMSLATANLIHDYALPLLIIGAVLTLAGTVGVFVSDGVRGRYAVQASKIASVQPAVFHHASLSPAVPTPAAPQPVVTPPAANAVVQNQLMTALTSQAIRPPPVSDQAADTLQEDVPAPAPEPAKAAPRALTEKQRADMLVALRGAAEDIWIVTERDPEAQHFADQIGAVFREAGWTDHRALVLHPGQSFQGVSAALKTTSADRSVSRAFAAAGMPLTFREKSADEPAPTVYVGSSNSAP